MSNHIIFRLLSKEDVDAIEEYNGVIENREYIDIPFNKVDSPFKVTDILTREIIVQLLEKAKAFQGTRPQKKKEFERLKKEYINNVLGIAKFFFRVYVYPSYYPITSGPELQKPDITVNEYLDVSGAWGGVRTTHGIHGFFTYDLDDTKTRTPNFYNDYGYWDGVRPRETGGNLLNKPKDIFINKFVASDNDGNLSEGGNFNTLFFKYDRPESDDLPRENVDVEYIDCSGGQATYTRGDDQGNVNFGADATCSDFEYKKDEEGGFKNKEEEDLIMYARLGKLMPDLSLIEYSDRREEINFRGKGIINGFHIKMSECVFMYDAIEDKLRPLLEPLRPLLDPLVENINTELNAWADDREKKRLHKVFFGDVHKEILKCFKGFGSGEGSAEKIVHLINELSSEPSAKKRRK